MTAQHDDEFAPLRQLTGMFTEELTKDTFAVVTLDCITHTAASDDAELGRESSFRDVTLENKRSALDTMTQTADSLKFAWLT